ncbi:MAG: class I SAM-dependent methyltransferase [Dehalococcoidia bacterium]|jgi:SAM-dependent methyltransferase|nr:class I SAM-dependent methyltransferase [Dehalococcoidia bacterium]
MDIENDVVKAVMEDLYGVLPRQGPGSPACTRRAFSLLGALPERPLVLDVGCGTGAQTMELVRLTPGHIVALDVFDWALDRLSEQVVAQGLAGRVHTTKQSMAEMDFREETFDLVWSEGALYIMGFENALKTCRRLLKPGGCLAASELCWLTDDAPQEARDFFAAEYPEMKTVEDNAQLFSDCGYELLGHFTEPACAWWDDYYTPIRKLLPALRTKYAGVPDALALFDACDAEMAVHEKHSSSYGYEFFVARRPLH